MKGYDSFMLVGGMALGQGQLGPAQTVLSMVGFVNVEALCWGWEILLGGLTNCEL